MTPGGGKLPKFCLNLCMTSGCMLPKQNRNQNELFVDVPNVHGNFGSLYPS